MIAIVVIEDGSLAIRGAIETLRESNIFAIRGIYKHVDDLPTPVQRAILLVDPFGDSDINLSHLACTPKLYMTLAISGRTQIDSVRHALQIGVRGFISKETSAATLLDAISAVGFGGIYLASPLDKMLFENPEEQSGGEAPAISADGLTPRERDVIVMVAQGLTHKQIGMRLGLSKATVDTYVQRIRQKLGSGNKADLTRLAIDLGLVHDGEDSRPDASISDSA